MAKSMSTLLVLTFMVSFGVFLTVHRDLTTSSVNFYKDNYFPKMRFEPRDIQFLLGMLHIVAGCLFYKQKGGRGSTMITLCMIANCLLLGNQLAFKPELQVRALQFTLGFIGVASVSFLGN